MRGTSGGPLLDRGCVASLTALLALRCLQLFTVGQEVFESAEGQLNFCFLYLTPQSLVCCALVPLFAPCVTGLLRHLLTAHVVVRRGCRREIVTSLVPRLLVRSLSYAVALVATGLLVVLLRSGYTFAAVGYVTFALVNIVLEMSFFCVCGLLMATVYVLARGVALPVCAVALYGAGDYLVSFVVKSEGPALCFGWGLTMVGPSFNLVMGLAGLARLVVISLALLVWCGWLVGREDLLGDGEKARGAASGATGGAALLYLPPVRRSHLVRLAVCVGVQACSALYLSGYGSVGAIEYALGGRAFVPREEGQIGLLVFLAALLPLASFLYCFSDFVRAGLGREGKLALPRAGSRACWALGSLSELTLFSCGFVALGSLASVAALLPFGAARHMGAVAAVALRAAPLSALVTLVLVCAVNLMCLVVDALVSCATILLAHAGTLMLLALAPKAVSGTIARVLPSSQGVLAWHDCTGWSETLVNGVSGFDASWSVVYLALVTVALGALVVSCVRRADVF